MGPETQVVLADAPLAVMLADAGVPAFLAPAPLAVMLVLAPSQSFQSLLRRLCWHWQMLEASSDLANFVLGKLHAHVPLAFGVTPR